MSKWFRYGFSSLGVFTRGIMRSRIVGEGYFTIKCGVLVGIVTPSSTRGMGSVSLTLPSFQLGTLFRLVNHSR